MFPHIHLTHQNMVKFEVVESLHLKIHEHKIILDHILFYLFTCKPKHYMYMCSNQQCLLIKNENLLLQSLSHRHNRIHDLVRLLHTVEST